MPGSGDGILGAQKGKLVGSMGPGSSEAEQLCSADSQLTAPLRMLP